MSKMAMSIAVLGVVAGLGVAAMPLSSYAATLPASQDVDVTVTVNNSLGLTVDQSAVNFGTLAAGQSNEVRVKATVSGTGNYTLNIKGKDTKTDLVSTTNPTDVIPAGTLTGATSSWGYKLNTASAYTAVTASDVALGATDRAIADDADTLIDFGIKIETGTADGVYEGGVTLTAVAGA